MKQTPIFWLLITIIFSGLIAAVQGNTYSVRVKTGTDFGAGTDSDIFIRIYGVLGSTRSNTGALRLDRGDIHDDHESGDDHTYPYYYIRDVGIITGFDIWMEGFGFLHEWQLDFVVVHDADRSTSRRYDCSCWFNSDNRFKTKSYPVNGGWSSYGVWSQCTKTCGTGSQSRSRQCNNPIPVNGGAQCSGSATQTQSCNTQVCPVDGNWGSWSGWSTCTQSCGGGSQNRIRNCDDPPRQNGGQDCYGASHASQTCNTQDCPVNGDWSNWSDWDTCSASCGDGTQTSTRSCTNPTPAHGGSDCGGQAAKSQPCNIKECPVNGNWTNWSDWGECSATCGTGIQSSSRTCTNPAPENNGLICVGNSTRTQSCNTEYCPFDYTWSEWKEWTRCSVTCNGGLKSRERTCLHADGTSCQNASRQTTSCETGRCPFDSLITTTAAEASGGGQVGQIKDAADNANGLGPEAIAGITAAFVVLAILVVIILLVFFIRRRRSKKEKAGLENPEINQYTNNLYDEIPARQQVAKEEGACVKNTNQDFDEKFTCAKNIDDEIDDVSISFKNVLYKPKNHGVNDDQTAHNVNEVGYLNGGWTAWSGWGNCNASCGGGEQTKTRTCSNPSPAFGGSDCEGDNTIRQQCNVGSCPVDGGWSVWSEWNDCTVTCGNGIQTKTRSCSNPTPAYGGLGCVGNNTEAQECGTEICPVDGVWDDWSVWGDCSAPCGGGLQTSSRTCTAPLPAYGGSNCTGSSSQIQPCNTQDCPVNGAWSSWSSWGPCSHTCGGGVQTKSRSCTDPMPSNGGLECNGSYEQTQPCNAQNCPVNGGWTAWESWGDCSDTCGGGTQTSTRTCTNPAPQYGGLNCTGTNIIMQTCNTDNCSVHGRWTAWSDWGACSEACGGGMQNSTRTCTNPSPAYGGLDCAGETTKTQSCNTHGCPVNGQWNSWGPWASCSVTCEGGIYTRERQCTNPVPSNGGIHCQGPQLESAECNKHNCPVHGGWSSWGMWSECTASCGGGTKTSNRTCTNPIPSDDGNTCIGSTTQIQQCNVEFCPVNGMWGEWTSWTHCSASCGGGTASKTRFCNNPQPQYGGDECLGDAEQLQTCNTEPCAITTQTTTASMTSASSTLQSSTVSTPSSGVYGGIGEHKENISNADGLSSEVIIVIAVGSVVLVLVIVAILIAVLRRNQIRKNRRRESTRQLQLTMPYDDFAPSQVYVNNIYEEIPAAYNRHMLALGVTGEDDSYFSATFDRFENKTFA